MKPPREYASPPCYLHELDPAVAQPQSWEEIRAWRKRTRDALIAQRMALAPHVRTLRGQHAKLRLAETVDLNQYPTLGVYWPMRGEINVREIARKHIDAGGVIGLPVVVERGAPVEFWEWHPGTKMQRGLWDIPIPAARNVVRPQALVIPLVGFDEQGYRLGYGGGYYDRTLAAASPRPFCVGFGYAEASLSTIYPQPHDIPMNLIVTDRAAVRPSPPA